MNWPIVKLEDVFEIVRGGSPRPIDQYITTDSDGLNWISIKDASNSDKYITKTKQKIKKEGLYKSRFVKPGDFLLTNSMSFGRPYIMKTTGCIHDGWLALTGDPEKVDPDYFYYLLGSQLLKSKFSSLAKGAVVKNLNINLVKGVEIPLPPLETQKQIAAVLDKADQLRKDCQKMEQELNSLAQSVFIDMFGDPVTNPRGWEVGIIRDLLLSANYGTSEKSSTDILQYPVLRMNNITYEGGWDFKSLKYMDMSKKDEEKYLVESGDILFNRTNSKELVGKTAVYREDKPMAYAGYLVRARCNELGNPNYISAFMNSKYGKQTLQSMCKSIVGMANINAQEFQKIKIAKPPVELQNEYSKNVVKIQALIREAKEQEAEYCDAFNALMQKAFKGELYLKSPKKAA